MSYFPEGFNCRDDVSGLFHLVQVDTPDGPFRFLLNSEGVFTDTDGNEWLGAALVRDEALGFGLGGTAKASSMHLRMIDDPADPDGLVSQILEIGSDYIKGRSLTRYVQPIGSINEMYAPKYPVQRVSEEVMDYITKEAPDAINRSMTLHLEGAFRVRGGARGLVYNVTDHARQLGTANPSYEFVPTEPREEKIFGT